MPYIVRTRTRSGRSSLVSLTSLRNLFFWGKLNACKCFSVNAETPCEWALKISIAAIDAPAAPLSILACIDRCHRNFRIACHITCHLSFPVQTISARTFFPQSRIFFLPRGQHESLRALAFVLQRVARTLIFSRGRKRAFFSRPLILRRRI